MRVIGVVRSPIASPGQTVTVKKDDRRVKHYLKVGVLKEVEDSISEERTAEPGQALPEVPDDAYPPDAVPLPPVEEEST